MARRAGKAVGFGRLSANSEGWLRTVILQWLALLEVWRAWAPACRVCLYVDDAMILISWDACCAYDAVPLGLLPVQHVAGHSPLRQGATTSPLFDILAGNLGADLAAHNARHAGNPPMLEFDELPDGPCEQHEGGEEKHDGGERKETEREEKEEKGEM